MCATKNNRGTCGEKKQVRTTRILCHWDALYLYQYLNKRLIPVPKFWRKLLDLDQLCQGLNEDNFFRSHWIFFSFLFIKKYWSRK